MINPSQDFKHHHCTGVSRPLSPRPREWTPVIRRIKHDTGLLLAILGLKNPYDQR